MTEFTPVSGFLGGMLIGIAALILLFGVGKIAGISGIYSGLLERESPDRGWRAMFVGGLIGGGLLWAWLAPTPLPVDLQTTLPWMLLAGFLVGFGTRLGNGCTSGHGVCGIGRLSGRSVVATITFMVTAIITTYLIRHLF